MITQKWSTKNKSWEIGSKVNIGFMKDLTVINCEAIKDGMPDIYTLQSPTGKMYEFIPHWVSANSYETGENTAVFDSIGNFIGHFENTLSANKCLKAVNNHDFLVEALKSLTRQALIQGVTGISIIKAQQAIDALEG